MEFLIGAKTDVGIKKKTNQDSLFIKVADTEYGQICLAVLCDGMGGLAKGELASATVLRQFANWFEEEFPAILYSGMRPELLESVWRKLISEVSYKIAYYSERQNAPMGSTVVALLLVGESYYIMNVGDSRAYLLTEQNLTQLTKDQTFIQREIDQGRMTTQEAKTDPRRNMLLQCVGASAVIEPDFYQGQVQKNSVFLLCSDGFRHVLETAEIQERLEPCELTDEETIEKNAESLIDMIKLRKEEDNISVALIKIV